MSAKQLDRIEKKLDGLAKDVFANRKALYSALKVVHTAAFVAGVLDLANLDKKNPKDRDILKCRKLLNKSTREFWNYIKKSGMDTSEFPVIPTNVIYEIYEGLKI